MGLKSRSLSNELCDLEKFLRPLYSIHNYNARAVRGSVCLCTISAQARSRATMWYVHCRGVVRVEAPGTSRALEKEQPRSGFVGSAILGKASCILEH